MFNSGYLASGMRKFTAVLSLLFLFSCHLLLIYSTDYTAMIYLGAAAEVIFRLIHTQALPIIHNNNVLYAYPAAVCHLKPSAHVYFRDTLLLARHTVHYQDVLK